MYIGKELLDFFQFIIIGVIISIIFDFFRAYRKFKKVSTITVWIQDIIYFVIATTVIVLGIINILDSSIRLYVFIAILVGCGLYFSLLSKHIIKLYIVIFNMSKKILDFFLLPFTYILQLFRIIYNFLKKIAKKCCKNFLNMVTFICKLFKKKTNKIWAFFKSKKNKPKNKKMKKQKRVKNNEKRL